MRRSPIRKVSDRQRAELGRRRRLKAKLMRTGPTDSAGRNLCWKCGGPPDWRGIQLVHLTPLARGGKTDEQNCELWCAPCHFGPDGHRTEA